MERKSRTDDARELEQRDKEIMQNLRMTVDGQLDVPLNEIPDGMEYLWARDTVFGDSSQSRIPYLSKRGWTAVPASRHTSLGDMSTPWRTAESNGYIMNRGLVLMQRPRKYGDEERRLNHEYQMNLLMSSPANADMLSDPSIPVNVYRNDLGVRARSFKSD